jgi:hypothetical protein
VWLQYRCENEQQEEEKQGQAQLDVDLANSAIFKLLAQSPENVAAVPLQPQG